MLDIENSTNDEDEEISDQFYQEEEDNDFNVKTIRDEKIIDSIPELDDENEFENEMYNFGDQDDLPDSDREMECQTKGISRKKCFDV